MTAGYRPGRGHTLIEVLIASALAAMVMTVVGANFSLATRFHGTHDAHMQQRQCVRNLVENLNAQLRRSSFIFQGFNGVMDGHTYHVPRAGQSGSQLVFAFQEGDGAAAPPTFTVVGVYPQNRSTPDPNNPTAQQIVLYQATGVVPPDGKSAASISPSTVRGGSTHIYDSYVSPGLFVVQLSTPANYVKVDVTSQRQPVRGPLQREHQVMEVALRNLQQQP